MSKLRDVANGGGYMNVSVSVVSSLVIAVHIFVWYIIGIGVCPWGITIFWPSIVTHFDGVSSVMVSLFFDWFGLNDHL